MTFQLYNEDCLIQLQSFEDNSIDCCITDPPYFLDRLDNVNWNAEIIQPGSSSSPNSHIKNLPKGMKFDKKQGQNLKVFYKQVSKLIYQKLKPGAFFLSFSQARLYHNIASAVEEEGFDIRDSISWVYTQSMPKAMSLNHCIDKIKTLSISQKEQLKKDKEGYKTPMLKSCHELVCVAQKPLSEKNYIQNELKYNTGLINIKNPTGDNKFPSNVLTTENFDQSYDQNFLISKPTKKEKKEYNTHITVKPIQLIGHLIQIFSKPQHTILDPFMGSGTTGVTVKKLGNRNFIGIEIEKNYFNISQKRIKEED